MRFFKKNIYLLDFVKDQRTEVVLYKERSTTSFPVFFLYQMSYKYFCVNFPSAPSYIKRRIYVKLTNTIHSAHIDFRENNTSWRLIVPSGFLINKVILKCSPLDMISHKNALLFVSGWSVHLRDGIDSLNYFQMSFCMFLKTDQENLLPMCRSLKIVKKQWLNNLYQRRIQNSAKHLRWRFLRK